MNKATKSVSRDELLAMNDLGGEEIFIAKWNMKAWIRELSAAERNELFALSMDGTKWNGKRFSINLTIACLCDVSTQKPIFTQADYDAVSNKSGVALDQIEAVALRVNAIGDNFEKAAEKN